MNRVAVVTLALLVVVGSVPAAATIADGAQSTDTDGDADPGAVFAGVVGVQGAEVDNEIDRRTFARKLAAASSNDSKAQVVAEQSRQLRDRLDELEAEKARLERAHENGSIGQGEYRARLATLATRIRAIERQAGDTADAAASLPEPALREHGANVSEMRSIARQANRTGGGEVAEAARAIAGESVGNGLGPPNASERGPSERAGSSGGTGAGEGNGPPENGGAPTDAGPPDGNGSDGASPADPGEPGAGNAPNGSSENETDGANGPPDGESEPAENENGPSDGMNETAGNGSDQAAPVAGGNESGDGGGSGAGEAAGGEADGAADEGAETNDGGGTGTDSGTETADGTDDGTGTDA